MASTPCRPFLCVTLRSAAGVHRAAGTFPHYFLSLFCFRFVSFIARAIGGRMETKFSNVIFVRFRRNAAQIFSIRILIFPMASPQCDKVRVRSEVLLLHTPIRPHNANYAECGLHSPNGEITPPLEYVKILAIASV